MPSVNGDDGTPVREPEPGVVAHVGYSGPAIDDEIVAALGRLADRTVSLDDVAWRATRPQVNEQHNRPSAM